MNLALIPARGGSKGIPRKNLVSLAGHPLLYYTIDAARNARCVDQVLLSSDDEEILEYGASQGAKILKRPAKLASDEASSIAVVAHVLENMRCENLIFLQPTSPLRGATHIDEAFALFSKESADALISVKKCDNKILKAFICDEEGSLRGICNDEYPFAPRQKLPPTFLSNGAIYILKALAFLARPSFLQPRTKYYLMDERSSMDIDCAEDLAVAEEMLRESCR